MPDEDVVLNDSVVLEDDGAVLCSILLGREWREVEQVGVGSGRSCSGCGC